MAATTSTSFIDTEAGVLALLDAIIDLSRDAPPLFIDLEGIKLSRYGSISILSLYIVSHDVVYLIDIHALGATAFSTRRSDTERKYSSFTDILESTLITKIFFDVRNDSDALFRHYQIHLRGIQDLQLMELAQRTRSKRLVNNLARCVEDYLTNDPSTAKFLRNREQAVRLFAPDKGGRYGAWNERPLASELQEYCVNDMVAMGRLYGIYHARLCPCLTEKVRAESIKRVEEAHSPGYQPHSRSKALGPWSKADDECECEDYYDDMTAADCDGYEDAMIVDGDWF